MSYKLTGKDKALILSWGFPREDLPQIEKAAEITTYEVWGRNAYKAERSITRRGAIRLLGRTTWLNGIARSAFHWTAARGIGEGEREVLFDSRGLFK